MRARDDRIESFVATSLFGPQARLQPQAVRFIVEIERLGINANACSNAWHNAGPVDGREILAHERQGVPVVGRPHGELVEVQIDARGCANLDEVDLIEVTRKISHHGLNDGAATRFVRLCRAPELSSHDVGVRLMTFITRRAAPWQSSRPP